MLIGRQREREILDRLLTTVRAGRSATLVLRGEPGIGKSALLDYAVEASPDLRIVRALGVESEMELAFAALHQLCAPLLCLRERLPAPQRETLATLFGLGASTPQDRLLIGVAVLGLLSEAASKGPLLCVVDDAHWLDTASARALGFVARRLLAEPVGMVIATREPRDDLRGLPEMHVEGLPDADACELFRWRFCGPIDEGVRQRLIAETRGNPLALLELPYGLSPVELAGGFGLPALLPVPQSLCDCFARRVDGLPEEARLLLLVAAADPTGDPSLVCRAAQTLGVGEEAVAAVERAGLLEMGKRARFRHPLVRSVVYRAAAMCDRRRVHRALADVTDPQLDPDRRVWHRARGTAEPDEEIAAELERSAGRARERGGLAAAAAFLGRAVELTTDPARRGQRLLLAATAEHLAGATDAAMRRIALAEAGPLDNLGRARVEQLHAHIAFAESRGSDAPPLLLASARRLEHLDPALARQTYLEALIAAVFAGRLARDGGVLEVARAALAAPPPATDPDARDLLLVAMATRFTEGYAAAAPLIRRAVRASITEAQTEDMTRWLWFAGLAAALLWDDEAWELLATRNLKFVCDSGMLGELPLAMCLRISVHTLAGELTAAEGLVEEARAAAEAIGTQASDVYGALVLAAWRGREPEVSRVADAITSDAIARGEGIGLTIAQWASAVLLNAQGRSEEALAAARRASEAPEAQAFAVWGSGELIIAASRCGRADLGMEALERLSTMTRASGTDWALGMEAGLRALLCQGHVAERLHLEAIDRLSRTRVRAELARAHLRYGQWLRRERRRLDARDQLRTAHEMLTAMGMEAFAKRAENELLAAGERIRRGPATLPERLTTQEAHVARLACEGLSNPEIGARLFISPRTAEYHLRKVFAKLGITSRNQLGRVLRKDPAATVAV